MIVWIIVGALVLGLLYLALAALPLLRRLKALQAQQVGLEKTATRAQQLAEVAQGLSAHTDALQMRLDVTQELIKRARPPREPGS